MQETWKDIEGYEGLYQVSNLGRVKSTSRYCYDTKRKHYRKLSEKILKQAILNPKYYVVSLTKNGKQRTYRVHRLVAKAFLPNPNNYPIINHIDCNKLNNNVNNLEWCTHKHNSQEAIKNNPSISKGLKRWNNKFGREHNRSKKVYQIDKDTNEIIQMFYGISEASRKTGICSTNIGNCCNHKVQNKNGKKWVVRTAGGYKWKFA